MPEVFARPPDLVRDFLCEEANETLRRSSPVAWAFLLAGGLLDTRSRGIADADSVHLGTARQSDGFIGAKDRLMRVLRKKLFDRFGRGGVS